MRTNHLNDQTPREELEGPRAARPRPRCHPTSALYVLLLTPHLPGLGGRDSSVTVEEPALPLLLPRCHTWRLCDSINDSIIMIGFITKIVFFTKGREKAVVLGKRYLTIVSQVKCTYSKNRYLRFAGAWERFEGLNQVAFQKLGSFIVLLTSIIALIFTWRHLRCSPSQLCKCLCQSCFGPFCPQERVPCTCA